VIRFRPLLIPTLISLPGIALAVGLGVWQLQRLEWKDALIEAVSTRVTAPAIPLDEALALPREEAEWRNIALDGQFRHDSETYLFAVAAGGEPGLHVITPFELSHGGTVLVDRGFVPESLREPASRAEGQVQGTVHIEGVFRLPTVDSAFTPPPDMETFTWFSRDPEEIAAALGIGLAADIMIEANAAPNPGGWPRGGQTVISFPNSHLQYAITWFGLALGLLAVYLVYHQRTGNLGVARPRA